jgi:low affinity Fe/Cu permease
VAKTLPYAGAEDADSARWYGFQRFLRPPENGLWSVWTFVTTRSREREKRLSIRDGTLRIAGPLFHMLHALRHALTRVGESTTHPAAFAVVAAYAVAWLIFSPDTFGWAAIATLATWLMTLFINRTEHRDTQAIHAKIDELLRTQGKARAELTTLDERDVEDIEEHRRRHRGPDTRGAYSSWPKK